MATDSKPTTTATNKPTRTFKFIGGGAHIDADGEHEAGTPTELVKSDKDLVAIHGSDRFVEVK